MDEAILAAFGPVIVERILFTLRSELMNRSNSPLQWSINGTPLWSQVAYKALSCWRFLF